MSVLKANQPLECLQWNARWEGLFAGLVGAAKNLNIARVLARFDNPSAVARCAQELYDLMKSAAMQRYAPPLEKLSRWERELYRSAMCYAHLRATEQAGMQWAALQRLVSVCSMPIKD